MHSLIAAVASLALAAEVPPPTPPVTVAPAAAAPAAAAPASASPPAAPPAASEKPAPAGPPRLAVAPLDAPKDLALLGRGLAESVAQEAVKVGGYAVVPPSEVLAKLGPEATAALAHCGDAAACYVGPALRLGVDRIVGGYLDKAGTSYRFGLVHVDAATGAAVARATREVPIASRRLQADVVAAAGPLLRGEAAGQGTLVVKTEEPGADVRIDDKPAGKTPLEAKVASGKHKVEVARRGKVKVDAFFVEVPAGGRVEQAVRLYDIPPTQRPPGEIDTSVQDVKKKKR